MWTPTTRRQHSRTGLRYETDLTDAEWAIIAPLLPSPACCGRPPVWSMREILNAILAVNIDLRMEAGNVRFGAGNQVD